MGKLILWGAGTSRTIRAHWAMHELGLAYDKRPIQSRSGETLTAEYTTLNPRQKIPLLQDDDFTIGESAAIVFYLSRTYGKSGESLTPEAPRDRKSTRLNSSHANISYAVFCLKKKKKKKIK